MIKAIYAWLLVDLGKVDIKIVKNTQEASDWTGDLQNSDQRKNKRAFSYLLKHFQLFVWRNVKD